jgi:hypothetical protein
MQDSPQTRYIYDVIEYEFERKKYDEQEKINVWKTLHTNKKCNCIKLLEINEFIHKFNIECDFKVLTITPKFKYNNFISLFLDHENIVGILSSCNLKVVIDGFRVHISLSTIRATNMQKKPNYFINKNRRIVENEQKLINTFKQNNIECHLQP